MNKADKKTLIKTTNDLIAQISIIIQPDKDGVIDFTELTEIQDRLISYINGSDNKVDVCYLGDA